MRIKFSNCLSILCLVVLGLLSGCASLQPTSQQPDSVSVHTTASFAEIAKHVSRVNAKYQAENVLIVLDIDNTLLTSTTDLGGDIWYQWQAGRLPLKPTPAQQVHCLYEDAIGLLYELNPMQLTEKNLPQTIADWQASGNTVLAITARAPKYRAATERELARKNIHFSDQQGLLWHAQFQARPLSYQQGIFMISGLNKGVMLEYLLNKIRRNFAAIIFVDDTYKNIQAVEKRFALKQNVETICFHYTKVAEDRKQRHGAVLTQAQAQQMHADWQQLNATLNSLFPARAVHPNCLSVN
jgi:hypothetical protein